MTELKKDAPTVAVWKNYWLPASETFVRNQVDALPTWHSVCVGLGATPSILARDTDVQLFANRRFFRARAKLLAVFGRSRILDDYFRRSEVDVIHAHFAPEAFNIAATARKQNIPLVVTLHGHDITTATLKKGFHGVRYRWRLRSLFGRAERIIAVSGFIRDLAISMGADPEKVTTHYIGIPIVDTPRLPPVWDVVFVGRLVEKKGVRDLLEAVSRLPGPHRRARVAIVGDGPLHDELRALAQRWDLNVDFLGMLSPDEVRTTLSMARVFCGPSKSAANGDAEGFGLVFAEAALARLPVVAYAHGGVVEAVAHGYTGLLAEEGDLDGLTSYLERLLADPELQAVMGQAARARVLELFDVARQSASLQQLYEAAVTAHKPQKQSRRRPKNHAAR